MAKYKSKPRIVDAEQYDGSEGSRDCVLKLADLAHSQPGWNEVGNELILVAGNETLRIPNKSWLVKRPDGRLEVEGPVTFDEAYELAED